MLAYTFHGKTQPVEFLFLKLQIEDESDFMFSEPIQEMFPEYLLGTMPATSPEIGEHDRGFQVELDALNPQEMSGRDEKHLAHSGDCISTLRGGLHALVFPAFFHLFVSVPHSHRPGNVPMRTHGIS